MFGRKLGELLDQAIGERQAGPIFLSPAGKAWSVPNRSRSYSRLRDMASLPRDLVLYLARHECGTQICREKWIEYARRLLGRANFSTTQRYMHLDDQELADAQDSVDLRARRLGSLDASVDVTTRAADGPRQRHPVHTTARAPCRIAQWKSGGEIW